MEKDNILMSHPRQNKTSLINIKEFARSRLLHDMLYTAKNKCRLSPDYIILVVDDYTSKLLSNFSDYFDLMENGNIYQIERLDLGRKRYP
jgi:hypothetical protein